MRIALSFFTYPHLDATIFFVPQTAPITRSPSCQPPDYSIYHDSISLKASDGQIQLPKLPLYKKAFGITRTMLPLFYDVDQSVVQSRMVYDSPRAQIRVSFNAMLVLKLGLNSLGGKTVHVNGILVYSIDLSSTLREDEQGNLSRNEGAGKIVEHHIERLLVNSLPLQAAAPLPQRFRDGDEDVGTACGGAGGRRRLELRMDVMLLISRAGLLIAVEDFHRETTYM